jgi:L-ascorbate 6-phosphate lactonase
MKVTWLTQGSFLFEKNKKRIVIDPYMSDCLDGKGMTRLVDFPLALGELKPDVLICSHDHLDHLDPESVLSIANKFPECIIAGPESCYNHFLKLGVNTNKCVLLNTWDKIELDDITVTAVTAHHPEPHAIGVLVEADGKKYYLSCDSTYDVDLINESTFDCDVVFICINGRLGNMSLNEALKVVETIKPTTAFPMHYGLFAENNAEPGPFVEKCRKLGINSFEMEVGKNFEI